MPNGHADHAALRLHDEVHRGAIAIRPGLAKAGDGAVDDRRVPRAHGLVVDAELPYRAHAVVLDQHVRAIGQAQEQLLAFRVLQIQLDALLVPVQVDEVRRVASVEGRPPGTRDVPRAGRLHLDHAGAEVAEQGRGERPGQRVGQVQHGQVVEGERHDLHCSRILGAF
jgi:hypothetical protein